jgi:hypothetical protein
MRLAIVTYINCLQSTSYTPRTRQPKKPSIGNACRAKKLYIVANDAHTIPNVKKKEF